MKNLLLIVVLTITTNLKSQIVFEHLYDSAANWNYCQGQASQLFMVKFEVSGERYVKINNCAKHIKVYDLNHNAVKTISTANLPTSGPPYNTMGSFLYVSEKLINTDSKMEFMYVTINPSLATYVYNEDGTLLFSEPGAPIVTINVHQLQYPIYNTAQGTKLIISYPNGSAKVFGLGGTLTTAIQKGNNEILEGSDFSMSNARPNPNNSETEIKYALPQGINEGEIVLYDTQAKEMKRFKVNPNSESLIISTSDLSPGIYFYQLQTASQKTAAKKMIVVK